MGRRTAIAAVVALGVVLTACGGSGAGPATTEQVIATTEPPSPAPSPTAADPSPTPVESSSKAKPQKSSASPTAEPVEKFRMPDLVGENLQDAQDELQSLGSFLMDQVDATGEDRWQLLDSNWYVCSQKPAAGKKVSLSAIVKLYVVKLEETCP
jgi:hypothetical protein